MLGEHYVMHADVLNCAVRPQIFTGAVKDLGTNAEDRSVSIRIIMAE